MDFDAIVKKYNEEEATPEEVSFVEETVLNARRVAKTRLRGDKHVSFLQKVKKFFIKLFIVIILIGILFGVGLFFVSGNARENMTVTKSGSEQMIYDYADQFLGGGNKMEVSTFKRRLVVTYPFSRSYYLYEYKVTVAQNGAYLITVDSYSGMIEAIKY